MSKFLATSNRDRSGDPYQRFLEIRKDSLRNLVNAAVIAEHRENPRGLLKHHSHELQEILNFLRTMPIQGEPFVYVAQANRSYIIGRLCGRGVKQRAKVSRFPG